MITVEGRGRRREGEEEGEREGEEEGEREGEEEGERMGACICIILQYIMYMCMRIK